MVNRTRRPAVRGRRQRNILVEANLGLVYKIAQHCKYRKELGIEDAIQEGMFGLIRAAELWDPARAKFSTYAFPHIVNAMLTGYYARGELIRRPLTEHENRTKKSRKIRVTSLDENIPGTELPRHETIACPLPTPAATAERQSKLAEVKEALGELDEKSQQIVIERYLNERTLQDVGDELGITRERTRQLENKAIAQLKWLLTGTVDRE